MRFEWCEMKQRKLRLYINSVCPEKVLSREEEIQNYKDHLKVWKEFIAIFKIGYEHKLNSKTRYKIKYNDSNILKTIKSSYLLEVKYGGLEGYEKSVDKDEFLTNTDKLMRNYVTYVDLIVHTNIKDTEIISGFAVFIENIFLAMNITMPGAMDLYRSKFEIIDEDVISEISLSGENLKYVFIIAKEWGWPKIGCLELTKTLEWIDSTEISTIIIAKKQVHKALFTLLNICGLTQLENISNTIWLSQGLESILIAEKTNNIQSILKKRITLILGEPLNTRRWLKEFYNIRSEFVHGKVEILRVSAYWSLDEKIEKYQEKFIVPVDRALAVFIALLQQMAKNNIEEFIFTEIIDYIKYR
jgi:hypothetical protein